MTWDLLNKVVVITGGAEGIGYDIADKYLQKGAKFVIILDINKELGVEAVKALIKKYGNNKTIFMKCDVTTDLEAITKKIFDSYTVDVLVNNAGIVNEIVPKKTIDINVTSVIEWSLKFWEYMRKDKGGKGGTIVNLASIYGIMTDQFFPVYQASKHAVMAFTKSLGHNVNYERSGVRVVAICPGFTESTLTTKLITWDPILNDDKERYVKSMPWQKVGAVGDAAVEIYQTANSGTAWKIEDAKPIVDVTQ